MSQLWGLATRIENLTQSLLAGQHMEDMYHQYLDCCSGKGSEFCQPVISAVEDAKKEAEEHLQEQKRNKKDKK